MTDPNNYDDFEDDDFDREAELEREWEESEAEQRALEESSQLDRLDDFERSHEDGWYYDDHDDEDDDLDHIDDDYDGNYLDNEDETGDY